MRRILRVIMGIVASVLLLLAILGVREFLEMGELARRASCRPNLLLQGCETYAGTHDGVFPKLSDQFGRLMFGTDVPLPYTVKDWKCDADPSLHPAIWSEAAQNTPVDDWSYIYLGYFIENEAQGQAFIRAYHAQAGKNGAFETDLDVGDGNGNCGTGRLLRLRTLETLPAELACLKDRASTLPVIIEWPENHRGGAHVVYLDGQRKFVNYPGKFPMTKDFIESLRVIDSGIHLDQ